MTPHITAKKEQIADIVLMPGDPLRAKWIAENFLENYELVNTVRNMFCYTGYYKNKRISVMGHGMGIPSIGIYTYELFNFYDVKTIIRVGSAGSYVADFKLGDVLLVDGAYSESNFATLAGLENASKLLKINNNKVNDIIIKTANNENIKLRIGNCHSSDVFYRKTSNFEDLVKEWNLDCVEMEAYALFTNAIMANKSAAVLLTCSDSLVTHEEMSAEQRQTSFKNMIKLALESSLNL